jgi:AcrR family transcriptional regulator
VKPIADEPPYVTKKPPVVQARALETRAKILAQAERAFAVHGFDGTSLTSDILEPAGVSVGSFYHQFGNKRDVLFAVFAERLPSRDEVAQRVLADERPSFADGVRHASGALLDDIDERPDPWWLQYRERLSPDAAVREAVKVRWNDWRAVICAALSRWYELPDGAVDLIADSVLRTLGGITREYLLADGAHRDHVRTRAAEPTVRFCVAGVEQLVADAGGSSRA